MKTILTFIIPVRHQDNAKDWRRVKSNLTQTVHSISLQTNDAWKAVIIANEGADLPVLPSKVEVKRVSFPPNPLHDKGTAAKEQVFEAFRLDKGRRVLAGMLHAGETGHFMIMDDDDFVSSKLTGFVAEDQSANGWFIKDGYFWGEGGKLLFLYHDFNHICGTSHIVRSDLYDLPVSFEAASEDYIRRMLGSHVFIDDYLSSIGSPLAALPFIGAIYRVGHPGAHSKSRGLLGEVFYKKAILTRPHEALRRATKLRRLSTAIQTEFGVNRLNG